MATRSRDINLEGTALAAMSSDQPGKKSCSHCGKSGHERAECYRLMFCSYCKKNGHKRADCYRLNGYAADKGERRNNVGRKDTNYQGRRQEDWKLTKTEGQQREGTRSAGYLANDNPHDQTTRKVIGVAKQLGGLYCFGCVATHSALASFEEQNFEKWHKRLGHPSRKAMSLSLK
ncbi:hypothetical protein CRG98_041295 [Punica granatum]|uniref:CCHC-type domain-containing protein n=1 Tax=Punica granatum TaxID=22663 RepID=A0A2I0I2U1_PUNGR|nr:hypothetical protein CRG98_041295 [Punica granatum]